MKKVTYEMSDGTKRTSMKKYPVPVTNITKSAFNILLTFDEKKETNKTSNSTYLKN